MKLVNSDREHSDIMTEEKVLFIAESPAESLGERKGRAGEGESN